MKIKMGFKVGMRCLGIGLGLVTVPGFFVNQPSTEAPTDQDEEFKIYGIFSLYLLTKLIDC